MTENEAIKNINALNAVCMNKEFYDTDFYLALLLAVGALEKIQKYEAIGTVEDWQKLIKKEATGRRKLEEYFMFGSVEEFKDLKEKAEAKKPILNNPKINEFYIKEAKLCPSCHSYINNCSGDYCRDCGQRIDWSK